jgi:predicted TIM-barrel fold metal-dependent hydrolase
VITDCHTHISSAATDRAGVAQRLAAEENIDKCIVLAGSGELASAKPPGEALSPEKANEQLAEYLEKHKEKMVGFALVDPAKGKVTEKAVAAATVKRGLKGCVLYCCDCGFHPAHSRAMQFYEIAQGLRLPVFFHNAGDVSPGSVLEYAQPYLLDEIARKFKDLKIIIGTMGMPFIEQTLVLVSRHENVYADLTIKPNHTWQIYTTVMAAYERDVFDKLLFGSGFPASSASECIEALLGFNKLLGDTSLPTVPRGEIRKIIERDSLTLLGIEQ